MTESADLAKLREAYHAAKLAEADAKSRYRDALAKLIPFQPGDIISRTVTRTKRGGSPWRDEDKIAKTQELRVLRVHPASWDNYADRPWSGAFSLAAAPRRADGTWGSAVTISVYTAQSFNGLALVKRAAEIAAEEEAERAARGLVPHPPMF